MDFDFAILKLKTLIPFSEYVNAVCLLSINSEIDFNQENNLVVSGWGMSIVSVFDPLMLVARFCENADIWKMDHKVKDVDEYY